MTLIWDYTLNWIRRRKILLSKNAQSLVYFWEHHELQLTLISRNITFFLIIT